MKTKQTRDEILKSMQDQLDRINEENSHSTQYDGTIEHPHGALTECNFGGLCIILNNSGDGAIVWRDWADSAIDEQLTEVEIDSFEDQEEDEDSEDRFKMGFKLGEDVYFLNEFMRV